VNDGPYLSCWSHNTVMELKMIDIAAVDIAMSVELTVLPVV
jgi:hypothetical protein